MAGPSSRKVAVGGALALVGTGQCFDLDPCSSKSAYQAGQWPSAAVACWSASAPWKTWPGAQAPAWAINAISGDAACRALSTPEGSAEAHYDGACAFQHTRNPQHVEAVWPPAGMLSWEAAHAKARETLALMKDEEKYAMMQGIGWDKPPDSFFQLRKWWYVGNTAAIPRLNIPSLNLQDAAGGFRTYWDELVGTVTCWPSLLAMAATWDPHAVREFAAAMGGEFAGKGANGILGPSLNVHRVARNGRNFEYLSGEDPYLGAKLAPAYLDGVHSQGLLSVAKHWVLNNQETNRNSESSIVDNKTIWELYYPPFQAAVDAGVAAFMCSYNRVNGEYSCSNGQQLHTLKEKMGFQGFVQSDWWAAHNTSIAQGLDQEMPGIGDPSYFAPESLAKQRPQDIDNAVLRILAAVHRMRLSSTSKCTPPNCEPFFRKNVTSLENRAKARTLAAESVVLLQNTHGVLPFSSSRVGKIAVVGAPAVGQPYNPQGAGQGQGIWWKGDYYAGGGSGHVTAGQVVTPLEGIQQRAAKAGTQVFSSPTDDVGSAMNTAKLADVVVVVAGTTSGESMDRPNLNLDGSADELIKAVAATGVPVVVLAQTPGAFLTPWRNVTSAILAMFLGGQETGSAWADVLFGDHAPTGRLPIMLPDTEADAIAPGDGDDVVYSEGLETSYRNKHFTAAYPFGHGLTYTTFKYLPASGRRCIRMPWEPASCEFLVRVRVVNTGSVAGRTVAQLYLEMPPEAGQPAAILKGFQKTPVLLPGASTEVHFRLTKRDLSYYDVAAGDWAMVSRATAHLGESSADIRQSFPFELSHGLESADLIVL